MSLLTLSLMPRLDKDDTTEWILRLGGRGSSTKCEDFTVKVEDEDLAWERVDVSLCWF